MTSRSVSQETLAEDGTIQKNEKAVRGVEVDVGNSGSRFFLAGMSDWKLTGTTVDGAPFERTYVGEEMARVIGVGVVGPDRNRVFLIPLEDDLDTDSISIEISP